MWINSIKPKSIGHTAQRTREICFCVCVCVSVIELITRRHVDNDCNKGALDKWIENYTSKT